MRRCIFLDFLPDPDLVGDNDVDVVEDAQAEMDEDD